MNTLNLPKNLGALVCLALGLLSVTAASATAASPVFLCASKTAEGAVKSGGSDGACKATYVKVALPSTEAEQRTLLEVLPHVKYVESGVGGKPTSQFSASTSRWSQAPGERMRSSTARATS
jgi:hypothetical protein